MYSRKTVTGGYTARIIHLESPALLFLPPPMTKSLENAVKESTPPSHSVQEPTSLCNTAFIFKKHSYQMITDTLQSVNQSGLKKKGFFPQREKLQDMMPSIKLFSIQPTCRCYR